VDHQQPLPLQSRLPVSYSSTVAAPLNEIHQRRTLRDSREKFDSELSSVLPCGSRDAKRGWKVQYSVRRYGFDSTAIGDFGVHTERCVFKITHSHLTTTISQDDFPRRCRQGSPMEQEFLFCGTSGHFRNCLKLQLLDAEATQPQTPPPGPWRS
jgi:hypothetical protein